MELFAFLVKKWRGIFLIHSSICQGWRNELSFGGAKVAAEGGAKIFRFGGASGPPKSPLLGGPVAPAKLFLGGPWPPQNQIIASPLPMAANHILFLVQPLQKERTLRVVYMRFSRC